MGRAIAKPIYCLLSDLTIQCLINCSNLEIIDINIFIIQIVFTLYEIYFTLPDVIFL